jgi:hypothetical protein
VERGGRVMLYGDHSYADLADVTLLHGWHNVLLIMALKISKINIDQFKWGVICQQFPMAALNEWKEEVLTKQNSIKSLASP